MIRDYLAALPLFSRNARLFLLSATLAGFSYSGIYFLLANLFLVRLGYEEAFIGVFVATGALSFAVFSIPAGLAGRRWGSRRAMLIGYLVLAAALCLLSLAPLVPAAAQAAWLIACCALREFGNAFYIVNANPFLMESTSPAERGHVFSGRGAVVPLAGFAGNLVGGALPAWVGGWTGRPDADPVLYLVPLLLSGLVLVPGWLALLAARETATAGPEPADALKAAGALLRRSGSPVGGSPPAGSRRGSPALAIAAMAAVGVFYIGAMAASMTFFNLYMDRDLGVSTARIGTIMALGQLLAAPVALTMAAMAQRIGYGAAFALSAIGVVASALILGLSTTWWAAGLGAVGITVLSAIAFPAITVYQQELVEADWRPLMSGAYMMSVALGWAAVATGGGYVIGVYGYRTLFLLGAALTSAGVGLFGACSWHFGRRAAGAS